MRSCISEETLQSWADDELAANEAGALAAHLIGCLNCAEAARAVKAENLVVSKALASEFEAAIPTERLRERVWQAVAALDHANAPTVSRSLSQGARAFFVSIRPLAYASIVAAILIAGFVGFLSLKKERTLPGSPEVVRKDSGNVPTAISSAPSEQPPKPASSAFQSTAKGRKAKAMTRSRPYEPEATSLSWQQRQYDYAIGKLKEAIEVQPAMPISLQVEYAYDLALIDNAITASRAAARRNPKDPLAAQLMLTAYQSKVDLMNQIANAR